MAKGKSQKSEILVINQIAAVGLKRLPAERYAVVKESDDPDAILVRSQDLHKYAFGPSLAAVGRAGAGTNNIPVAALSKRGVPVFNAPGANANAVKELVLAGMLIAARNLGPALDFVRSLGPDNLEKRVEDGKKQFAGFELPGHTLGVIGLGKVGSLVADSAIRLGMNVPFTLKDSKLDEPFLKGALERGMVQLKGHRSVGGMRASIYNAMPLEGVKALVDYMREFEKQHG